MYDLLSWDGEVSSNLPVSAMYLCFYSLTFSASDLGTDYSFVYSNFIYICSVNYYTSMMT